MILTTTADTFGFSVEEFCGPSRRRPLVIARQIGMYVFRELTDFSYPAIAREFGGRDHTTVIHAVEKIAGLMKERRDLRPGDRPILESRAALDNHVESLPSDGTSPHSAPGTGIHTTCGHQGIHPVANL